MKYLKEFNTHASYEDKINIGGSDLEIPIVSYCDDVSDVHYNPYNTVEFYVGNITGTTQQTVKMYTGETTSVDITVSEGNKWYSYVLPKDKGLYKIEGVSVKKVAVKANINFNGNVSAIIPMSTVEASFKGSNTSKVTNMYFMFNGCSSLTSLDVSSFDTSNVTNMRHMFISCSGLKSLDLSSFNTSKVTNMYGMFSGCRGLTSLVLSNFKTNNVTDMSNMFVSCSGLTSLDLSSFNTSKVTNMASMFNGCRGLTSLVLSNFKTNNVNNMNGMFANCSGLTFLDLSGWDMNNATTQNMFGECAGLRTISMKGCSLDTITKIKAQLKLNNLSEDIVKTE